MPSRHAGGNHHARTFQTTSCLLYLGYRVCTVLSDDSSVVTFQLVYLSIFSLTGFILIKHLAENGKYSYASLSYSYERFIHTLAEVQPMI